MIALSEGSDKRRRESWHSEEISATRKRRGYDAVLSFDPAGFTEGAFRWVISRLKTTSSLATCVPQA
jgi:hypothetical protein